MKYIILVLSLSMVSCKGKWDLLRHFGIHKFQIGDCVVHAKDIDHPYRIYKLESKYYLARNIQNPIYITKIIRGNWEENFFNKVDCP